MVTQCFIEKSNKKLVPLFEKLKIIFFGKSSDLNTYFGHINLLINLIILAKKKMKLNESLMVFSEYFQRLSLSFRVQYLFDLIKKDKEKISILIGDIPITVSNKSKNLYQPV